MANVGQVAQPEQDGEQAFQRKLLTLLTAQPNSHLSLYNPVPFCCPGKMNHENAATKSSFHPCRHVTKLESGASISRHLTEVSLPTSISKRSQSGLNRRSFLFLESFRATKVGEQFPSCSEPLVFFPSSHFIRFSFKMSENFVSRLLFVLI